MSYRYIAVDLTRQNILMVSDTLANLNKQLLSVSGQRLLKQQGVWIYRIDNQTLQSIQVIMARTGAPFSRLARPA